jgi:hypothetical protein
VSLLEPPVEQEPLRRFFTGIGAAALAVVTFIGLVATAFASRWRGILLAHIFFLTLWLALQVFLYAREAYAYLRDNIPTWFSQVTHLQAPSTSTTPAANVASSKPVVTNCWRDRSLDGDCFKPAEPHRKPPPHHRRIPEPCPRFYICRFDDI